MFTEDCTMTLLEEAPRLSFEDRVPPARAPMSAPEVVLDFLLRDSWPESIWGRPSLLRAQEQGW